MQTRELPDLQRRVAKHRGSGAVRFPTKLREQVATWVARRREHGAWWSEIAREVGVPEQTLKRWSTPRSVAAALLPVEVIDAPPIGAVTLVTPTGIRIEGVSIADAIAMLRGLG